MIKNVTKLFLIISFQFSFAATLQAQQAQIQVQKITYDNTQHQQKPPPWLKPYAARYTILRDGDDSGYATRTLTQKDKHWELVSYSRAKVLFFTDKRTEITTFEWNQQFQPLSYIYEIKNSFKKQLTKEYFDKDLKMVRGSRSKKGQWQIPFSKGLADPLNHQLLLRQQLIKVRNSGKPFTAQTFSFDVTSKGSVQHRQYQLIAEEKITTQAGEFDSYKLVRERGTRKTIFWMAKQLDFIPVKIYQQKDGDEQATMVINKIEFTAEK